MRRHLTASADTGCPQDTARLRRTGRKQNVAGPQLTELPQLV